MEDAFVKTAGYGDNLPGEAAALRWLAEAEPRGGIRVARVLSVDKNELAEERVATGAPSAAAARRIGAARAHARRGRPVVRLPARRLDGGAVVRPRQDPLRRA